MKEAVLMLSTWSSDNDPTIIGFNGKQSSFNHFGNINTIVFIQEKLMMISTSHMKITRKFGGLVRHRWLTKCGFSAVMIKNDRLISNDFITVQNIKFFNISTSRIITFRLYVNKCWDLIFRL